MDIDIVGILNYIVDLVVPDEQVVIDFAHELFTNRKISKTTFDATTAKFGQRVVMTLTDLVACYAVLAYNKNTSELEAPTHASEPELPA